MEEEEISELSHYFTLLRMQKADIFRGVSKIDYQLIPSIGREWLGDEYQLEQIETDMLEDLANRALPFLDYGMPANNLEWLILGQHHGMPTRLLDWTTNPLVALFFTCNADERDNGAVYLSTSLPKFPTDFVDDPFRITQNYYIVPRHLSRRIPAQSAVFTIHQNPSTPMNVTSEKVVLEGSELKREPSDLRIIIPNYAKVSLLEELRAVGIGSSHLFPGIDGVCGQIGEEALTAKEQINHEIRMQRSIQELVGKSRSKKKLN